MAKISVIVPVYNVEKYLEKCINSILKQNTNEVEVIIVNDGSTDNSAVIAKRFESENPGVVKYFEKQNGGLSDARNFGVNKVTGDYLCFVDSDDYISESLFNSLEKYIQTGVDLIKYKCIRVNEKGEELEKVTGPVFETPKKGDDAFNTLYGSDVLTETAWLYLYKTEFYKQNNFNFPVGKYHEDWGTVPLIILKASSVISTDIYGYYYVQSANSITRNNSDEKIRKRAYDMLEHYDNATEKLANMKLKKETIENYKIYMSNCLVLKLEELPEKYHKEYIDELKKRKIADNFKARDFKQFIKKCVLKINYKLYLKIR